MGHEIDPTTEGISKCLVFEEETAYFVINDTIQEKFEYEVALGKSIYSVDSMPIIHFEGHLPCSYEFGGASILFREEVYDGYIHEYEIK